MSLPSLPLKRSVPATIVAVMLVAITVLFASDVISERELSRSIDIAQQSRARIDDVHALSVLQKQIEFGVVHTQEALTDVSATRALDGLDDGFEIAGQAAKELQENLQSAMELADRIGAPKVAAQFGSVRDQFGPFYDAGVAMAKRYVADGPAGGNAMMASFDAVAETLQTEIEASSALVDERVAEIEAETTAAYRKLESNALRDTLMLAALGSLVLFLGIGLIVFVLKRLINPLTVATEAMNALADGNTEVTLAGADRKDEMGELARAFAHFRDNLVARRQAEEEGEAARHAREADERHRAAQRQAEHERIKLVVETLGSSLERLAEGDLTTRIDTVFEGELDRLRANFNDSVERLSETMGEVKTSISTVNANSSEMRNALERLSERTEQQAASLEETSAALEQITSTVKSASERAQDATSKAAEARGACTASTKVVGNAVDAMSRIEGASSEIGNIIGVIDEIAFQTNLLALNAGVEAARAGEAGKGFAVVAQEVRELAQRSASAAKEIKELIAKSTGEVEGGVKLVRATGEALEAIAGHVADINDHIAAIATASQEQATGLDEINTAVGQMDQVTQQNAAMVEETTAVTHRLAEDAGGLSNLVARFSLAGSPVSGPAPVNANVAPPAAPSPARAILGKVRNAFSARTATAAAQDWEEF